ncbi:MAG: hypothetical protein MUE94_00325 [Verrucomicrobia bacterium]|jgi:hypothetical protein|nr:hypothetical protein [Verrucomicrobiota bacterium]
MNGFDGALISLNGANTWSGPVTLNNGGNIVTYVNANSLTLSGAVGGAGGLSKCGFGNLILSGSTANTTYVQVGKLRLEKTIANAAVPADVVIYYYSYLADTHPLDVADNLRITSFARGQHTPSHTVLQWTSKPTRFYGIQRRSSLSVANPWEDLYTLPLPGANHAGFDQSGSLNFYRIRALRPLTP